MAELRAFLSELGPRASERGVGDPRPTRDRLIGDIGVFVGLRNDEIHQLTNYQFLSLHPDPDAPYADQALTVIGKGRIRQTVAIPNWLVQDALAYAAGERYGGGARAGGLAGRREPQDLFVAGRHAEHRQARDPPAVSADRGGGLHPSRRGGDRPAYRP